MIKLTHVLLKWSCQWHPGDYTAHAWACDHLTLEGSNYDLHGVKMDLISSNLGQTRQFFLGHWNDGQKPVRFRYNRPFSLWIPRSA